MFCIFFLLVLSDLCQTKNSISTTGDTKWREIFNFKDKIYLTFLLLFFWTGLLYAKHMLNQRYTITVLLSLLKRIQNRPFKNSKDRPQTVYVIPYFTVTLMNIYNRNYAVMFLLVPNTTYANTSHDFNLFLVYLFVLIFSKLVFQQYCQKGTNSLDRLSLIIITFIF